MSNELYQRIGQRIRAAREGRFSQKQLAQGLGFTQGAISKFERGERPIAVVDLMNLAKFLGKDISYFIDESPTLQIEPALTTALAGLQVSLIPLFDHVSETEVLVRDTPAGYLPFPSVFLKGADFAMRVRGISSFEPDICHDDIILVRRQAHAEKGRFVVIRRDERFALRRFPPDGQLHLASDVEIVGQVVRLVRDM